MLVSAIGPGIEKAPIQGGPRLDFGEKNLGQGGSQPGSQPPLVIVDAFLAVFSAKAQKRLLRKIESSESLHRTKDSIRHVCSDDPRRNSEKIQAEALDEFP